MFEGRRDHFGFEMRLNRGMAKGITKRIEVKIDLMF
jgi:hypothetical protein